MVRPERRWPGNRKRSRCFVASERSGHLTVLQRQRLSPEEALCECEKLLSQVVPGFLIGEPYNPRADHEQTDNNGYKENPTKEGAHCATPFCAACCCGLGCGVAIRTAIPAITAQMINRISELQEYSCS